MWADLALALSVVGAWLLSKARYNDVFTPLFSYAAVWCASLLLFRLRLVDYDELNCQTALIIAASVAAFGAGCMLAGKPSAQTETSLPINQQRLAVVITALLILNVIGLVLLVRWLQTGFGLLTNLGDVSALRASSDETTRVGALGFLTLLDLPLLLCAWMYYLRFGKRRWFTVLGVVVPLLEPYLKGDRGTLTFDLLTMLFLWIYYHGWRRPNQTVVSRVSVLGVVLLGYFLAMGSLLDKLASQPQQAMTARQTSLTSGTALALVSPYIYATASFPTLQQGMQDVDHFTWGARTFFPVARLLYALGVIRQRPEPLTFDFYFVPVPFNTYTHLFTFYQDFGTAGIVLVPLLLGWLETRVYLSLKRSPGFFSLTAAACFLGINCFSIFIPIILSLSIWYCLTVLWLLSRWCRAPWRECLS